MVRGSALQRRRSLEGWLFVSPFVAGFLLFFAGPMLFAVYISLCSWPIMEPPTFVGLKNFGALISDEFFWTSLRITVTYVLLSVPLGLISGLGLALLLNQKVVGLSVFRTLYYMPTVITGAGLAVLWWTLFNTEFGMINTVLRLVGLPGPPWLTHTRWVIPSFVVMSLWQIGGSMILYLAGLQGIPTELYEAVSIDGAGSWVRFYHITLPMLSPVLLFNLVMGIIGSFQSFTNALVMTNGGPGNASLFYGLYLYRTAWKYCEMGYAAALAWVLFGVILLLTITIFRTTSTRVFYAGGAR